jgi:ankyrin repeat protein
MPRLWKPDKKETQESELKREWVKAIEAGDEALVRRLIHESAGINQPVHDEMPLRLAAARSYKMTLLILDAGARSAINCALPSGAGTALEAAATAGNVDVVELLLDNGAMIDAGSPYWKTPLRSAAHAGHLEVVRLLLDRGAFIEAGWGKGETALKAAAQEGHIDILRLLLDRGAQMDMGRDKGERLLQIAARAGHIDIVHLLLEHVAQINGTWRQNQTAIERAIQSGHIEVIQLLLDRGASINRRNDKGEQLIHLAAQAGHIDVVKLLADRGAYRVGERDNNGHTPLHLAAQAGHIDIVKFLLDNGADIESVRNGKTALYLAASRGHIDVIQLLLDRGARQEALSRRESDEIKETGDTRVLKLLGYEALDAPRSMNSAFTARSTRRKNVKGLQLSPEASRESARALLSESFWPFVPGSVPDEVDLCTAVDKGDIELVRKILGSEKDAGNMSVSLAKLQYLRSM